MAGPETTSLKLTVSGLCERPMSFGGDELRALGLVEMRSDVRCPAGSGLDGALWGGVPLIALVAHCVPASEARYATIHSGPYATGFRLDSLERRGALLAVTANGVEVGSARGGPIRLVVAKGACFDMVKNVDGVSFEVDGSSATAVTMVRRRHNFKSGANQP